MEKGNPDFNIANVEPSTALSAVTPEDLAFEMELQRAHQDEQPMPQIDDHDPVVQLKQDRLHTEMLKEQMIVEPATSIRELDDQVHAAKELGCDSVEATKALVKSFCRKDFDVVEKVGFFLYHDIKVFIQGRHEEAVKSMNQTIESRMFSHSKIVGQPIMISEKK